MSDLGSIAKALAAAQAEMVHAAKDRTNPHFRNEYATLASVINACKPALNKHGIAIVQLVCGDSLDSATVETMLLHESGQSISARYSMPVAKKDAQGHGSAITYARRYSLLAIVGLAADDDDGNDASERGRQEQRQEPARQQQREEPPAITHGPAKGKRFIDATGDELNAYGNFLIGMLDDQSKREHHAKAQTLMDAVSFELARRGPR